MSSVAVETNTAMIAQNTPASKKCKARKKSSVTRERSPVGMQTRVIFEVSVSRVAVTKSSIYVQDTCTI